MSLRNPLGARRGAAPVLTLGLLTLGLSALPGCGDDEPTATTRGTGRAAPPSGGKGAKPKPKAGKGAEVGATDESRVPARLRGLKPEDWDITGDLPVLLREGRDPFMPHVADLVAVKTEVVPDEADPKLDIQVKVADDVRTLTLIAVVSGSGVPHAMMRDSSGLGHLLIPGDVVGAEIPFRVARITRNEVLFKPLQAPEGETQPTEVSKVLLTQQELEDLLP